MSGVEAGRRETATLAEALARRITLDGPMTLATFMAEALGHPRFGYYMTRDPLGAAGDFTTAPEISQMFGELLGLWCADTWGGMGAPADVRLVELGPGRGTLMADALRALRLVPALRGSLTVHMVETSPVLRRRQAETLAREAADLAAPVSWHAAFDEVPEGPLLVLANEFFDALPVRQVERTPLGWSERLVDIDPTNAGGGAPRFRLVLEAGRGPGRAAVPAALRESPLGSVFEWCPGGEAVAEALGARLTRYGGAALIIDYGHAGPAPGDTLQAMRRHAFAAVLENPGEADITAHVDFTALATAAGRGGAKAWGPVGQGDLLRALGIDLRASVLASGLAAAGSPARADEIAAAHARLTAPDQMGTLFKALCVASPGLDMPAGFAI